MSPDNWLSLLQERVLDETGVAPSEDILIAAGVPELLRIMDAALDVLIVRADEHNTDSLRNLRSTINAFYWTTSPIRRLPNES